MAKNCPTGIELFPTAPTSPHPLECVRKTPALEASMALVNHDAIAARHDVERAVRHDPPETTVEVHPGYPVTHSELLWLASTYPSELGLSPGQQNLGAIVTAIRTHWKLGVLQSYIEQHKPEGVQEPAPHLLVHPGELPGGCRK